MGMDNLDHVHAIFGKLRSLRLSVCKLQLEAEPSLAGRVKLQD